MRGRRKRDSEREGKKRREKRTKEDGNGLKKKTITKTKK